MEPVGPVASAEAARQLLETMPVDAGILDIRLQGGLCFAGLAHRAVGRPIRECPSKQVKLSIAESAIEGPIVHEPDTSNRIVLSNKFHGVSSGLES
jgi:hypothetical protein